MKRSKNLNEMEEGEETDRQIQVDVQDQYTEAAER